MLEFVDTHVHFWDRSVPELEWGWLAPDAIDPVTGDDYGALNSQRFLPAQLAAESRFQAVSKVVHVQAATGVARPGSRIVDWVQSCDPVAETRWLQSLSDASGVPAGIVAYADLAADDVGDVLERHGEHSALRGIRDLRYDDYLRQPAWERGVSLLARHDLVLCDAPALEDMLDAARLAARHPDITLCVDHAGFPHEHDVETFGRWRAGIRALAAVPNTVIKISGLGMGDPGWTVDSLRPWVLECICAWGTDRAFFGTNWPVDRLYSSYSDVVSAYRAIIADFSIDEQAALLAGNAKRVFSL